MSRSRPKWHQGADLQEVYCALMKACGIFIVTFMMIFKRTKVIVVRVGGDVGAAESLHTCPAQVLGALDNARRHTECAGLLLLSR